MNKINISYAGCNDSVVKKLSMASSLLKARGVSVSLSPWSGTRTDVVFTDIMDPYGKKVYGIAEKHSIATIVVHKSINKITPPPGAILIHENLPTIDYFNVIESLKVPQKTSNTKKTKNAFLEKFKAEKSPILKCGDAIVHIDYESGVCRYRAHRDMLHISDALKRDHPVSVQEANSRLTTNMDFSVSIENFFFNALASNPGIRWNTERDFYLKGWPDIRSRQHPSEPMTLSSRLIGKKVPFSSLAEETSETIASAFLYACYFCGLLAIDKEGKMQLEQAAALPSSTSKGKVLSTLKKWLGVK